MNRSIGSLVVRLALELQEYKEQWRQAEQATREGVGKVETQAAGAARASDSLTDAARKQTGALGEAKDKATALADALGTSVPRLAAVAAGAAAGAAAIGALAVAAYQGNQEQKQLNDTLLLTGNYAGLMSGQLDKMAMTLAASIGGNVGSAREVLAGLVATGRFTVDSLESVGEAVQLVARYSGQTNTQVLKDFAGMADGVSKWAAKHNEAYHFLNIETLRYIKQLDEQGEKQAAMRVTSEALSKHLGGDLVQNLGLLESAWNKITSGASAAWAAMKGVGKTEGLDARIDAYNRAIEGMQSGLAGRSSGGQEQIRQLEAQRDALLALQAVERVEARVRTEVADATINAGKADDEWAKGMEGLRTKSERMKAELQWWADRAKTRSAVTKDPEVLARIDAELVDAQRRVREKYADKSGGRTPPRDPYESLLRQAEQRLAVLKAEEEATEKLTDAERTLIKHKADLANGYAKENQGSERAYRAKLEELVVRDKAIAQRAKEAKDREEAAKREAKEFDENAKANADRLEALEKSAQQTEDAAKKDLEHVATLGLTKRAVAELQAAKLEDMAVSKERLAIEADLIDISGKMGDAMRREAAALRTRAQAARAGSVKEEAIDAAREAAKEWERTGQVIEDALYGGVQAGLRKGESFSKAFFKGLEQAAATTTLRFGAQVGTSILGFSSGNGGGSNVLGAAGAGSSILNSLGLGASALTGTIGGTFGAGVMGGLGVGAAGGYSLLGGLELAGSLASSGAMMGAAGAALGTLGPIGMGAALIYNLVNKKAGGPKVDGAWGLLNSGIGVGGTDAESNATAAAAARGLQSTYAQVLGAYGRISDLQYGLGFSSDPKGTSSSFLDITASRGGATAFTSLNRDVGRSPEAMESAIKAEGARMVLRGLREANLGGELEAYLMSLGDLASLAGDAAESALARVTKAATEKQQLEERLFQLQASDIEKLTHVRDLERKAVDAMNLPLLERVYALEDEKKATAEATAAAAAHQAQLQADIATSRRELEAAYTRESSALRDVISRSNGAVEALRAFGRELASGPLAMLTVEDQYRANRGRFEQLAEQVKTDPSVYEDFIAAAREFATASQASNSSGTKYFADLEQIRQATAAARISAAAQVNVAQLQLDALRALTAPMIKVDGSVLSVREAVLKLAEQLLQEKAGTPGSGLKSVPVIGGGGLSMIVPDDTGGSTSGGWQYGSADLIGRVNQAIGAGSSAVDIARGLIESGVTAERMISALLEVNGGGYNDAIGATASNYAKAFEQAQAEIAAMRANSHADGLHYVPYDNYPATLHRAERVLTADQARTADAMPSLMSALIAQVKFLGDKLDRLTNVSAQGFGEVSVNTAAMAVGAQRSHAEQLVTRGLPVKERAAA
ncbi:phage tail length tape measure family protein [Ramlibacter sp.]|uniref:phage tail length tape measure family protein n=1 Tax=Ramlibacter sp. TaxID=1917967 RepID=UPI003D11C16D